MRHESYVARQKLSSYLVFQFVARQHLNACDICISASDKVRLIRVWHQNHILYNILNISQIDAFHRVATNLENLENSGNLKNC